MKKFFTLKTIIYFLIAFPFCVMSQTKPELISAKILNYQSEKDIIQFEKLEIGLKLPKIIEQQVLNFIENKAGKKINPFLEWELKINIEFHSEKLDTSVFVDAFYYEKFKPYMVQRIPNPRNGVSFTDEEYQKLGGYQKQKSDYMFLVRFAPFSLGDWTYRVRIKTKEHQFESGLFDFFVNPGENKGYVNIGKNKRYFEIDTNSFYPVGCNVLWPNTVEKFDPDFAKKSQYEGVPFSENYRGVYVVPRVYEKYKKRLLELNKDGANLMRMIMYPVSTDIEWEELGNYSKRMHMAQELDEILKLAEKNDFYYLWNLQIHYTFQNSENAYYNNWTWEKTIQGKPFCYKKLLPSDNPIAFFQNEEAKKYYKQRLRYILSRWGYSTNIALFELISEVNNVMEFTADEKYKFYEKYDNWKVITQWQKEMGEYIKSLHNGNVHLLTTSFAGEKHKADTVFVGSPYDVYSSNIYDYGEPSNARFWIDYVSKKMLNEAKEGDCYALPEGYEGKREVKPLIFSETGVLSVGVNCNYDEIEMTRLFWYSLFSGVAGAFDWENWYRPETKMFGQARKFIREIEFDKEEWHPGASKRYDNEKPSAWEYSERRAKGMIGKNGLVETTYLRKGDRNAVVGVLSNLSYNVYSIKDCLDKIWDEKYQLGEWRAPIREAVIVNTEKENIRIRGLKLGKYVIEYYYPDQLEKPFKTDVFRGMNGKISVEIGNEKENYIVLFKIYKK